MTIEDAVDELMSMLGAVSGGEALHPYIHEVGIADNTIIITGDWSGREARNWRELVFEDSVNRWLGFEVEFRQAVTP